MLGADRDLLAVFCEGSALAEGAGVDSVASVDFFSHGFAVRGVI